MASHAGLVSNCTCSHLPARRPLRLQSPACNASQRLSSTFVSQPVSSSCSSLSGTTLHSRSLAARPSQRPQRKVTSMAAKGGSPGCSAWQSSLSFYLLHNLKLVLTAVVGMIKLALQAGKANPAPPVGPALGSKVSDTGHMRHLTLGSCPYHYVQIAVHNICITPSCMPLDFMPRLGLRTC